MYFQICYTHMAGTFTWFRAVSVFIRCQWNSRIFHYSIGISVESIFEFIQLKCKIIVNKCRWFLFRTIRWKRNNNSKRNVAGWCLAGSTVPRIRDITKTNAEYTHTQRQRAQTHLLSLLCTLHTCAAIHLTLNRILFVDTFIMVCACACVCAWYIFAYYHTFPYNWSAAQSQMHTNKNKQKK